MDVLERVVAFARTLRGDRLPAQIDRETAVRDLGLDSLDLMELVGRLEEESGVTLPDEQLARIETIADLEECLCQREAAPRK